MLSHFFERRAARAEKRRKEKHCHRIANAISYQVFKKNGPREREHTKGFFWPNCISWQISPLALEGEGERSQRTSLVEIFNKKESLPRNITAE